MTAHELARELLKLEDLPVTSYWGDPPDPCELEQILPIDKNHNYIITFENEYPNNPNMRCYLLV